MFLLTRLDGRCRGAAAARAEPIQAVRHDGRGGLQDNPGVSRNPEGHIDQAVLDTLTWEATTYQVETSCICP